MLDTKETHCPSIMKAMNCLRQDKMLSDVCLIVGGEKIPAHRCVLAAGSDYFRSRFLGPFRPETIPNVDLTSVTTNVATVESVINFLYTGLINIDLENLEYILKVSSFLLISELRTHCIDYMQKTLDVNTIVKYYLLSTDHMIADMEQKLADTLKSRFHDWLIFRESSLEISPKQLLLLIRNCNVFEYCSDVDIIVYLVKWVRAGGTESHELLSCDVLDFICERRRKIKCGVQTNDDSKQALEKLKITPEGSKSDNQFYNKLNRIVNKYFSQPRQESQMEKLRSLESRRQPMKLLQISPKTENVVVTLSPKQRLIEYTKEKWTPLSQLAIQEGEAIFDICVYIPRMKSWYYMREGSYTGVFKGMSLQDADWTYFCMFDQLGCVSPYVESVDIISLRDFSYRTIDYQQTLPNLDIPETTSENYCMCTADQAIYLVLRIKVFEDDNYDPPIQIYFKCYKLTSDSSWNFMFSTPRIDTEEEFGCISASVSLVSNELLLLYNISSLHVFVADLKTEGLQTMHVHELSKGLDITSKGYWHIVEDKSQFLLAEVVFSKDGSTSVSCRYKYRYKSKVLTPSERVERMMVENTMPFNGLTYPCEYFKTANDKKSVWIFEGSEENGSCLSQVTFDHSGRPTARSHKPPPFSCITTIVSGEVDTECIASLKPVIRYLG